MRHFRLDIFYPGRGRVFARFSVIVEEVRRANRSYQLAVILYKVSDTHTEYLPDETWPRVKSCKTLPMKNSPVLQLLIELYIFAAGL